MFKSNSTFYDFNLTSATRLRIKDGTRREHWSSTSDMPLYVRLKLEDFPWIVGHRGHKEFVKSVIFAKAAQNQSTPEVVHLMMRTWTRRARDPITRKFIFVFKTSCEAKLFVFVHNCFLEYKTEDLVQGDDDNKDEEDEEKEEGQDGEDTNSTAEELGAGKDEGETSDGEEQGDCADFWFDDEEQVETQDPFSAYLSD